MEDDVVEASQYGRGDAKRGLPVSGDYIDGTPEWSAYMAAYTQTKREIDEKNT